MRKWWTSQGWRVTALAAVVGASAATAGIMPEVRADDAWKPEKSVEIVVPQGPGSQLDTIARVMQAVIGEEKLVDVPVVVVNKPGGSQSIAASYILSRPEGDAHSVLDFTPSLMTGHIMGNTDVDYAEATPLACLGTTPYVWAVQQDSPIASGTDLLDRLRKDPASVVFGTSNIGGLGHIQMLSVLKAAGIDISKLKMVGFKGGGAARAALLGGHVDLISTSAENMVGVKQEGKVRLIALNAKARLGEPLADVPTWKEQGLDAHVISAWICFIGPRGLSATQVAYWDRVFQAFSQTDQWVTDSDRRLRQLDYLNSSQTADFLKSEYDAYRQLITDIGLVAPTK